MDASSPAGKHRHRSILVVGNKAQDLLFISLVLQRFNYEVFVAHNVAQALERVAKAVPALILSDLVLPGMSGIDLFLLLKQDKQTASVPMVFMIPMSDAAAERRCTDIGAMACVPKPVQAEELYRTVQAILEPIPRADIRIDTKLPVSVNNEPLACDEGGCRIDLSEHGMFVPMHPPFPKNKRVNVEIHIKKDLTISAEGSVLYSHTSAIMPYKQSGIGLKFTKIAPQDQECLRKFIREEVTRDVRAALARASSGQL